MSFVDFFKEIVFKIDSSEKTNKVLTIFQASAAASIGVYTIYAEGRPDIARLSIYTFWIFQSIILLYFVGMLAISEKYRAIKLRLRRTTGALYDKTTDFRNVSLRAETLKIILDGIKDTEKSYEIGKDVGANFYSCYEELLQRKGKIYSNVEDKLKNWLEYDSSSGMGKFEVLPHTGFAKIKVTSPFMGTCPKQPNQQCRFLMGYIDGFSSKLYEKELESKCEHNPNPSFCTFTLESAN